VRFARGIIPIGDGFDLPSAQISMRIMQAIRLLGRYYDIETWIFGTRIWAGLRDRGRASCMYIDPSAAPRSRPASPGLTYVLKNYVQ
jgi:hypothetical protein